MPGLKELVGSSDSLKFSKRRFRFVQMTNIMLGRIFGAAVVQQFKQFLF